VGATSSHLEDGLATSLDQRKQAGQGDYRRVGGRGAMRQGGSTHAALFIVGPGSPGVGVALGVVHSHRPARNFPLVTTDTPGLKKQVCNKFI